LLQASSRENKSASSSNLVAAQTATQTNETDGELPGMQPQLLECARARGHEIDVQTTAETAAAIQEEQRPNTSRTAGSQKI
jgi:hypothetical protein